MFATRHLRVYFVLQLQPITRESMVGFMDAGECGISCSHRERSESLGSEPQDPLL